MKSLRNFSAIFLCIYASVSLAELPENYQSFNAEEKQSILWSEIQSSEWKEMPSYNNDGWSSILRNIKALLTLSKTFDHVSDEIPAGRPKFIHTYGSVAKVRFIPEKGHPFTGIYKDGGIGLARLSLAANPLSIGYTPGMAVKFLIDGNPSLNLQVMYSLDGQGENWNFFANDFSNKISEPTTFALKLLGKIFAWVRSPATDLPVNYLASVSADGKKVERMVTPTQLIFKPTEFSRDLISADSREDLRTDLKDKVDAGTPLYHVFGKLDGKEVLIGTLVSDSEFIASFYGDKKLFFQHHR